MKKSGFKTARSSGHRRSGVAPAEPKRRTHIVPKVVFRTAFAGVVPVCVAASSSGCGASVAVGFVIPIDAGGGMDGSDAAPDADGASNTLDGSSDASQQDEGSFGDAGFDRPIGDSAADGSFGDATTLFPGVAAPAFRNVVIDTNARRQ